MPETVTPAKPETAPAPAPGETMQPAPAVNNPSSVAPTGFAVTAAAPMTTPAAMPAPVPGAPAAAGDVDVIEPEWVEKAENVIAAHVNDPYGEEEAVEKLQEEYLQQRYGIKVADPNADPGKTNGS